MKHAKEERAEKATGSAPEAAAGEKAIVALAKGDDAKEGQPESKKVQWEDGPAAPDELPRPVNEKQLKREQCFKGMLEKMGEVQVECDGNAPWPKG